MRIIRSHEKGTLQRNKAETKRKRETDRLNDKQTEIDKENDQG